MKVQISKLVTVSFFLLLGLTTSFGQVDCDCDFSIDPVCVTLDNGEVLTFLNPCLAACEGFDDDAIAACDGTGWPGDDCECPEDIYDPVCVLTAAGIICPFPNMCEAECAGYTDADVVPCEGDCNCPDIYDPVCIISSDGINFEFPNACWAECAGYNADEIVACEDPCNCPDVWDPVCVVTDDGIFYQFGNLCEAECQGFGADQVVECENDCPCTEEYDPVCVLTDDGILIEFQNACFAACEGYGPDQFVDCTDPCICTDEWDPVCVVSPNGDIIQFGNACEAACEGYGPDQFVDCENGGDCSVLIIASQVDDEGFVWAFGSIATGNVDAYFWDFGDGNTSTEGSPVHTYTTPGLYFVTLTITTEDGCEATTTHILYAGNCYNIIIALYQGNYTYAFGAIATGSPVSWYWEFGDGETSTEGAPVHTYPGPGAYDVSLTTVHEDSCVWTSTITIEIIDPCICTDEWDPVCVISPNGDIIQFGNSCEAMCEGYGPDTWFDCENDCNCTEEYDPVCVILNDGTIIEFPNPCHAACEGYGPDQFVDCTDPCICTDEWDPVCVLDGDIVIIFSNLCEAECAGYGPDQIFDCEGDCNCTEEYNPVCVISSDGEIIEFPNPCQAECAGYGPDTWIDCENDCNCPDIWDPVCVVTDFGEFYMFENLCEAECYGFGPDDVVDCEPDCVCTDDWNPVCVTLDDGITIEFSNACWAECAGFNADEYEECDGVIDNGPVDEAPILHVIFNNDLSDLTEGDLPEFFQDMMDTDHALIENAKVFPNPVLGDVITLEIEAEAAANATISIVSLTGESVIVMEEELVKGVQKVMLNASKLVSGIYFTKIETPKGAYTLKFIRQ